METSANYRAKCSPSRSLLPLLLSVRLSKLSTGRNSYESINSIKSRFISIRIILPDARHSVFVELRLRPRCKRSSVVATSNFDSKPSFARCHQGSPKQRRFRCSSQPGAPLARTFHIHIRLAFYRHIDDTEFRGLRHVASVRYTAPQYGTCSHHRHRTVALPVLFGHGQVMLVSSAHRVYSLP